MTVVIDMPEARSIYVAMEGIDVPRPQSHDLMRTLIAELGGRITQICITDLRDRTFYATLQLEQGSMTYTITARPSDAIALAARVDAPIFVSEHVMDEAGQIFDLADASESGEGDPDVNPDELIDEFKSFLADVKAGDFEATGEEPAPDDVADEQAPEQPEQSADPTPDDDSDDNDDDPKAPAS